MEGTAVSSSDDFEGEAVVSDHVLDPRLVKRMQDQTLIDHGYCTRDNRSGVEIPDDSQLKSAVLEAMSRHHVVRGNKDLSMKAVNKFELYSEIFPEGPGVTSIPDTPEAIEAQKKLTTKVWGYIQTGTTGHVQQAIAASGMVLCEAKVSRTLINEETGKREPTLTLARFLTSDHALILTYYTAPAGVDFTQASRKLENKLSMVVGRQPELASTIAKQMAAVVKAAIAAIPHADPKHVAALVAGSLVADEAESA
ncbi:hypothetical protein [Nocardia abscessus]|uniref:hypothetical protein n=1 Tax=Nocardia abscessus TaxID=120957 RepID=UPI0024565E8A|nr:hypothetical protein [Nocardia abscessus]